MVFWVIMDDHEKPCTPTQTCVMQLYSLVFVWLQTTKCASREQNLTETVEVTWTFHAVTLKGWCLVGRGWYMSKCGRYVLMSRIQSVQWTEPIIESLVALTPRSETRVAQCTFTVSEDFLLFFNVLSKRLILHLFKFLQIYRNNNLWSKNIFLFFL